MIKQRLLRSAAGLRLKSEPLQNPLDLSVIHPRHPQQDSDDVQLKTFLESVQFRQRKTTQIANIERLKYIERPGTRIISGRGSTRVHRPLTSPESVRSMSGSQNKLLGGLRPGQIMRGCSIQPVLMIKSIPFLSLAPPLEPKLRLSKRRRD